MQKTIVITGASSGIGEATSRLFALRGWNVVMAARSDAKMQSIANELSQQGGRVLVVPTDVTAQEDVERLIQQTMEHFGRIDVLINNAGMGLIGTVAEMKQTDLEELFRLNVFAPVAALQAVVPIMRRQGDGVIVNVSSVVENVAVPFMSAYAASKIALSYLTDAARIELRQSGIDVVNVLPGRTSTSFFENTRESGGTGEYDLSQFMGDDAGAQQTVAPTRVAETIWLAVRKRPRRIYVSLGDRIGGEFVRRIPGLINLLMLFALERYVPRKNGTPQAGPAENVAGVS